MNDSMFNTLESHTANPEELRKKEQARLQAENEAMAAKVAASLAKHGGKTEDEVNVEDVSEYLNAKYTTETE